jgi:altronate dehydratase
MASRRDTFQTMTIQDSGGTKKIIEWGVERLKEMLPVAARREARDHRCVQLTLALQCGGSDGYSGITANPALGYAADILVRNGGTAILSETPEDLWRRASADAPRRQSRGRRKADRAHPLVGRLHPPATMAR